jgi:glycosyltransferase A (GT-A) superfamily protein (DUF2064 family)
MADSSDAPLALAVMAKAPIPGEAKTRLAQVLGAARAVTIYRAFLLDTLAAVDSLANAGEVRAKLVVCPDERHAAGLRSLVGAGWRVAAQQRRGLMGGLVDAFDLAFRTGAEVAIATDADSPLVLYDHLAHCACLAAEHDVTLGPTDDGGYYLIGARRAAHDRLADLLLGEAYQSATICDATIARARALGLDVGVGPVGFDVDTASELSALVDLLDRPTADRLRHTRAALTTSVIEEVG